MQNTMGTEEFFLIVADFFFGEIFFVVDLICFGTSRLTKRI